MINVIMLTNKDFAGSGKMICEAVTSYSKNINIRIISANKSNYGCVVDYLVDDVSDKLLQNVINNADIIHYKGDHVPLSNWFNLKIPNIPKVITVGGSGFRRHSNDICISKEWDVISKYVELTNIRTCLTPDLNYTDFDAMYIPHAIDSETKDISYVSRDVPIISHSPSARHKKGTDNIIIPAINKLKDDGLRFEFNIIENVNNNECIDIKKNSNIFIDQICDTGFYGMSAVESMQYGIPTVAHISQDAINQSNGLLKDCPVVNVCKSIESLYETLKDLLSRDLTALSKKTKKFCDTNHSYNSVGKMYDTIYNKLYDDNKKHIQENKISLLENIYFNENIGGLTPCVVINSHYGKVGGIIYLNSDLAHAGKNLGYLKFL